MTMSRWDNQAGLHSFSNSRSYRKAFWHPGIGPWQFDSAGLGAAQSAGARVDSFSAAETAASAIADRWCTRGSKSYVWAPWYGCGPGGATCAAIFDRIFVGGRLRGLDRDGEVSSLGGMERRRCTGPGASGEFLCHRVDPARAEGHRAFTAARYGPAPITAPYCVYVGAGREYRIWRRADTGYDVGIWARRRLGANARSALVWRTGQPLRDLGPWADPGPGDGPTRPRINLTRARLVVLLWRRAGRPAARTAHDFTDVNVPRWYGKALSWAQENRVMAGYADGTFRPAERVSRARLIIMLWREAGRPEPRGAPPFADVPRGHRYADAVAWAAEHRYIVGFKDNTFRGNRSIGRAQADRVLARAR